jgi:cobalt-precorrin 5A hydrolase
VSGGLPQPLAVYALTSAGAALARELVSALPGTRIFLPLSLFNAAAGEEPFYHLAPALMANFNNFGGHVVLAATGIVVRAIAPLLKHKAADPAVVVVDQAGLFAISLLSGHLGGANALARRVAQVLGGQAVITTATDSAGLPSLEMLAAELGYGVENLAALARLSMILLDGDQPAICDPQGWLWPRLQNSWPGLFAWLSEEQADALRDQPLVWVGWRRMDPAPAWLIIRPPALWLGLGCNRGTSVEEMESLLRQVLDDQGLAPACLAGLASVEAKSDEAGLLELAARLALPLKFFSTEELAAVEVPNPSPMVAKHMGVASVCEAAALLAAGSRRLLVSKHKSPNVTLAVALASPRENFTS